MLSHTLASLLAALVVTLALVAGPASARTQTCGVSTSFPTKIGRGQVWQGTVKTPASGALVTFRIVGQRSWYNATNGPRAGTYYVRVTAAGNRGARFYVQAKVDTGFCQASVLGAVTIS